jgi:hypothetical protein
LLALALSAAALLPLEVAGRPYGPVATGELARQMPEFGPAGRLEFFESDPYRFWIANPASGLDLRKRDALLGRVPVQFELAALAASLPLLLLARRRLPIVAALNPRSIILVQLLLASIAMFLLAHLLVFRLYLPNRYIKWSVQLVVACAAGLGLGMTALLLAERFRAHWRAGTAIALALMLATGLACYPTAYHTFYVDNRFPRISAYLIGQPKDTLVAGLPGAVSSIPPFSGRPVLHSMEHALPFHLGYHALMTERLEATIRAFYAESPDEVLEFADEYGVDIFLVDVHVYDATYAEEFWPSRMGPSEGYLPLVRELFEEGKRYALRDAAVRCPRFVENKVAVVPRRCVERL